MFNQVKAMIPKSQTTCSKCGVNGKECRIGCIFAHISMNDWNEGWNLGRNWFGNIWFQMIHWSSDWEAVLGCGWRSVHSDDQCWWRWWLTKRKNERTRDWEESEEKAIVLTSKFSNVKTWKRVTAKNYREVPITRNFSLRFFLFTLFDLFWLLRGDN
jgi:hypothetical protein